MMRNQSGKKIIVLETPFFPLKTHNQSSLDLMILHQGLVAEDLIHLDTRS
jgi:hypothetical protein